MLWKVVSVVRMHSLIIILITISTERNIRKQFYCQDTRIAYIVYEWTMEDVCFFTFTNDNPVLYTTSTQTISREFPTILSLYCANIFVWNMSLPATWVPLSMSMCLGLCRSGALRAWWVHLPRENRRVRPPHVDVWRQLRLFRRIRWESMQ